MSRNKFLKALFAKPWAFKFHYKDALEEDNIIDVGKLELELGILWILIFIFLIIII